jgi:pyruvate/2-oxoglutarate dehydrogenase complex dihydrolipoamide acyltransferase (E2) component
MTIEVILPKFGLTMIEGTLAEWLVQAGQHVSAGQILASIETDKATSELEAPAAGVIARILIPAGTEEVPVGTVVCLIEENEAGE